MSGGSPHLQPRPSLGSPRGPSGHFLLAGHILVPALWNHIPPPSWNQPSASHPTHPQSWPLPKPSPPKSPPPALAGRTPGQRSEEGSEPLINAPGPLWGLPDFMLPNPAQAPTQMQRKMQREGMVSLGSAEGDYGGGFGLQPEPPVLTMYCPGGLRGAQQQLCLGGACFLFSKPLLLLSWTHPPPGATAGPELEEGAS